MQRRSLRGV